MRSEMTTKNAYSKEELIACGHGELFGEQRFQEAVLAYRHLPAVEMARSVEETIRQHEGKGVEQGDDRALVLVKFPS